jgi:hypothetical protein
MDYTYFAVMKHAPEKGKFSSFDKAVEHAETIVTKNEHNGKLLIVKVVAEVEVRREPVTIVTNLNEDPQ